MLNEFNFIFNNDQIHIEFDQNGIAWFRGPEIARVLEYEHPAHMYRMLDDNEMNMVHFVDHIPSRGNPNIVMINEFGLYHYLVLEVLKLKNSRIKYFMIYYRVLECMVLILILILEIN